MKCDNPRGVLQPRQGPQAVTIRLVAELRIHQVTRALGDPVNKARARIDIRRGHRGIRRAAVNLRTRPGDALRGERLIPFRVPADERHQFVFPVDFRERVGVAELRGDIRIERMMQEKVSVVQFVILLNRQADLPEIRQTIGACAASRAA